MYSINATFVTSCNTANVCALDVIVPRPSTNIMPKEFQSLLYILHFFGRVEMTRLNEFAMLIYIYNNAMRSCNERTTLYTVSSLIYITLFKSIRKISGGVKQGRKKIDNIIIYIVENIKFIYTSFDKFFLPVSQRVEMNYIFFDNVRTFYLSCYFKSPKETVKSSKKSRNRRCSNRFWFVFSVKSVLTSL